MKNLCHILFIALFLWTGQVFAQTPDKLVEEVRKAAAEACVTVTYSMTLKVDGVLIQDEGTVIAQDDMWCLKGQSMEIYTGSEGTWILHPESREAMVEPGWSYDDLEAFYLAASKSGEDLSIRILSKDFDDKRPVSQFVPVLGLDWIVTDLR